MRDRRSVLVLLPALAALAVGAAGESARVTGLDVEGRTAWVVPIGGGPGAGIEPAPLLAPAWLDPAPDVSIDLIGGGRFDLARARGKVVVLDFWASWCVPCLKELPAIERLAAANAKSGRLAVVAVNANESDEIASRTASALKLTLPLGRYGAALDEAYRVRSLPTLVLIDAKGRVSARFDGYREGIEAEIAARVEALLAGAGEPAPTRVGEVVSGPLRVAIAWARELDSRIEGVAAQGGSAPRVLLSAGRSILVVSGRGEKVGRTSLPGSAGRLLLADLDGDGRPDAVSYRPGARQVLVSSEREASPRKLDTPEPVLSAGALGAAPPAREAGRLAIGTPRGVFLSDGIGGPFRRVEGSGETIDVAPSADGSFVALESGGALRTIRPDGTAGPEASAPLGDLRIVSAEPGGGASTARAIAAATCRLSGSGGPRAAVVATSEGDLAVIDLERGAAIWRARWPGVEHLAAADVDGDGRDEVVLVAGKRVALLEAAP